MVKEISEEKIVEDEFEPLIVAFCCNWCSYAGADLAGTSRFEYPTNIRIIRVMCSGRIDPAFVLEALKDGADGVLVAGCHLPSDCHYISGQRVGAERFEKLAKRLEEMGISPKRFRVEWISAAEGAKYAQVIREMDKTLKSIDPQALKEENERVRPELERRLRRLPEIPDVAKALAAVAVE